MNNITWLDIATLIIAAWGAGLSTYLGFREWRKDRRSIKIFIEYITFYEKAQIRLVNIGHRPITIKEIGIEVLDVRENGYKQWEDMHSVHLFHLEKDEPTPLPLKIEDGESATIWLSEYVNEKLRSNNYKVKLRVFDVEGKIYKKYKLLMFNPKLNRYEEYPVRWTPIRWLRGIYYRLRYHY